MVDNFNIKILRFVNWLVAAAIEVTLDDQGSPWESKNKPKHKDL